MNLKALMKRNGQEISISMPDGWESGAFYGFLQPLRYKNKMYLYGVNTPIGYNSEGYYLYIGPPEHDLTKLGSSAVIGCGGMKYQIDRAEKVNRNGVPFYIWAVVRTTVVSG